MSGVERSRVRRRELENRRRHHRRHRAANRQSVGQPRPGHDRCDSRPRVVGDRRLRPGADEAASHAGELWLNGSPSRGHDHRRGAGLAVWRCRGGNRPNASGRELPRHDGLGGAPVYRRVRSPRRALASGCLAREHDRSMTAARFVGPAGVVAGRTQLHRQTETRAHDQHHVVLRAGLLAHRAWS